MEGGWTKGTCAMQEVWKKAQCSKLASEIYRKEWVLKLLNTI